jgi:hypothetical protein
LPTGSPFRIASASSDSSRCLLPRALGCLKILSRITSVTARSDTAEI